MPVRLVVTLPAQPGKGSELAGLLQARAAEARREPGCEQFDVFRSLDDPDTLVLLERWADQAALDAHAQRNATRPPLPATLRAGAGEREDYEYRRTR